ncbi:MAG: hypothetical protein ACFE9S_09080 [Candidatus Hermodarchaeota archaeon]
MAKIGKALSVIALIFGMSGVLIGGFALIQLNFTGDQPTHYVLPMARVYLDSSYNLNGVEYQRLNYTHKSFDSHDAFNLATDEYIVPETGFYQVVAQYSVEAYDQDLFIISIFNNMYLNGTCAYTVSISTFTWYFSVAITDIITAFEGDAISINTFLFLSGPPTRALFPGEHYTYFSIVKINNIYNF